MFIDLDKFKAINDTYGHAVGDKVLRTVGQRLQASVRTTDTISRRSGDEFLCLMLEVKDDDDVKKFARKMIANIVKTFELENLKSAIRASIGIAVYPEHGKSAEALLNHADIAMYKAKQSLLGYCFFDERSRAG